MTWDVDGSLDTIELEEHDGLITSRAYPDALRRVWAALHCPGAGDVLVSAQREYEFVDWGGSDHVGGGSHGSLRRGDSLAALAFLNCGPDVDDSADAGRQWSITDVGPGRAGSLRRLLLSRAPVAAQGAGRTASVGYLLPGAARRPTGRTPWPCKRPCPACRPRTAEAGELGAAGQVLRRGRKRLRRQPRRLYGARAPARRPLHPCGGARVLRGGDEQLPLESSLDV